MKSRGEDSDAAKVAVATLDAKAYYTLTSLLKELSLPFESIVPGEDVGLNVKLVLTTRGESGRIAADKEVMCFEDVVGDPAVIREKIFSILYSGGKDALVIGVDPGERTGIVAHYREKEIFEEVTKSFEETVSKVAGLVRRSHAKGKMIRIGDGNPEMAQSLAERLLQIFKDIDVEIVDERRTTSANPLRIRGSKDLASARIISLRRGRRYR